MKLSNILSEREFSRLQELTPTVASAAAPGAAPATTAPAPGAAQATQDPQAAAKMQAQQALDRMNQKKQLQDTIKQTQEQIVELQKQLADQQKQLATLK